MSSTTVFVMNRILGFLRARSSMIFEARKCSLRCTIVTSLPKRLKKLASSIAESPPPTTIIFFPRKKKPSQVAQELTPCPINFCSLGRLSQRAEAPVAISTCAPEVAGRHQTQAQRAAGTALLAPGGQGDKSLQNVPPAASSFELAQAPARPQETQENSRLPW